MSRELAPFLEKLGIPRRFAAGALLFAAGEPAGGFHFVRTGEVRVYKMDERGREVELVRASPGDFVGEAVVFAAETYPAFAQAVRETRTRYFGKKAVIAEIDRNPAAARFFLELLAGKCLILNERLETLSLRTVRQRLAQHLVSSCSGERECLVELRKKKSDLARYLGTISETLSRTLAQMESEGLIEVRGRKIRIIDCPGLRSEIEP